MEDLVSETKREERQLKYKEAHEKEIEKQGSIAESMALRREMARERFIADVEGVDPEHQELPHLGKHDRDPPLSLTQKYTSIDNL
ncbi:hypothetical protein KI387_006880, partial [Taxus chinensis]